MTWLESSIILNVGSIILGLGAWSFGSMAIASKKMSASYCFSVGSFGMCAVSLLLQLLEINNRINISDFSAIEDTIRAVIIAAVVLVVVTIVLNIAALFKGKDRCLKS